MEEQVNKYGMYLCYSDVTCRFADVTNTLKKLAKGGIIGGGAKRSRFYKKLGGTHKAQ
jgi:hypothetical protein